MIDLALNFGLDRIKICLADEFAAISFRQPGLDLIDLPGIELDIVLDRLGGEPVAGAVGVCRQRVELGEGFVVEADRGEFATDQEVEAVFAKYRTKA